VWCKKMIQLDIRSRSRTKNLCSVLACCARGYEALRGHNLMSSSSKTFLWQQMRWCDAINFLWGWSLEIVLVKLILFTTWDSIHFAINFAQWEGTLSPWNIHSPQQTLASVLVSNTAACSPVSSFHHYRANRQPSSAISWHTLGLRISSAGRP